ncbi:MAG: hypothetical protein AAF629_28300 [Chloroflexota bacterium]
MCERLLFANAYVGEAVGWCQQITAGKYDFVEKQVKQTQSTIVNVNKSHEARAGAFLSAFFKMTEEVKRREEALKQEVLQLKIEIDEVKRQKMVKEVVETDYFDGLQAKAQRIRTKRNNKLSGEAKDEEQPNP